LPTTGSALLSPVASAKKSLPLSSTTKNAGKSPAGPERLKLAEGSTAPDEHLLLSLAAARLRKPGTRVDVIETAAHP